MKQLIDIKEVQEKAWLGGKSDPLGIMQEKMRHIKLFLRYKRITKFRPEYQTLF